MTTYYQDARLFNGQELLSGYSLAVNQGKTIAVVNDSEVPRSATIVHLNGGILTPGFVELQANGGGGVLFNDDPCVDSIKKILAAHRQFGTVAMLPTFITDEAHQLDAALQAVRDGLAENVPGLMGGHFEGPFINKEKKGTHQVAYIRRPSAEDYRRFSGEGLGHSLVTLAPECVPIDFIQHLASQGFRISAGHTMASKADMVSAHQAGLSGITHLYNAMPVLQGRDPAVIGSAAPLSLNAGIIVDGIHSDPFSLQTAFRLLGKRHLMLVTDSMHTIGAPEIQSFTLTGQTVFVKGDRLVNENGDLAGAHITMAQSVKNARTFMQASIADVLTMAITTPARYIGCEALSHIHNHYIDDILYLDEETLSLQPSPLTA